MCFCAGVGRASEGGTAVSMLLLLIIPSDLLPPKEEDGGCSSVRSVTKLFVCGPTQGPLLTLGLHEG